MQKIAISWMRMGQVLKRAHWRMAKCCEAKESPLDLARVARVINLMFC
jgi:hypothetical protein